MLWAHGGAFITGSPVQDRAFASHLAAASGAAVYLPDYRLAPEHTAAEQVADLQAALSDLPEERVVIGGDSAGGCLALLVARAPARPLAGMALVSPVVDLTLRTSGTWTGSEIVVRRAWAEAGVAAAFGTDRPDLLTTDLDGLPPAVVHVSEHERLRPEGEALAQRLGAEPVVLPGLWHVAHLHCGCCASPRTPRSGWDAVSGCCWPRARSLSIDPREPHVEAEMTAGQAVDRSHLIRFAPA